MIDSLIEGLIARRAEVHMSEAQLNGVYDFEGYRRVIASLVPDDYKPAPFGEPIGRSEDLDACVLDAATTIWSCTDNLPQVELNTLTPGLWVSMADLIACALRISSMYAAGYDLAAEVITCVDDVAQLVDLVGCLSDVKCRETYVAGERDWSDITASFLNGSGIMWLDWAINQGYCASATMGMHFNRVCIEYMDIRRRAHPLDASAIAYVAMTYDMFQRGSFVVASHGIDVAKAFDASILNVELMSQWMPYLDIRKFDDVSDLFGWCKLTKINPEHAVFLK